MNAAYNFTNTAFAETNDETVQFESALVFALGKDAQTVQDETFEVPSGCGCLSLQYYAEGASKRLFGTYLMIRDPEGKIRFHKQLGSSEPVIGIGAGAADTTIGGVPGPIMPGKWHVRLFLPQTPASEPDRNLRVRISDERLPLNEVIGGEIWTDGDLAYSAYDFHKIYNPAADWYKGDLHTHTRLSDGRETPQNASRKAVMMELDFYVPTEHNALHTGWPKSEVMILPGMEVTAKIGHMNLFGVDKLPRAIERVMTDNDETRLREDYADIISESKNRGWLISINHPFLYPWKWLYRDLCLLDLDCLEIVNDPTYEADPKMQAGEANKKAIYLADLLWEDGYRVCAVGGSDSHRLIDDRYPGAIEPSVPGDPATWLYMNRLSPEDMKKALWRCSGYVSRHCSLRTQLRFGAQLPADQEWLHYEIHLRGCRNKPDIFYKHNGMKIACAGLTKEEGGWCVHGSIYLNKTAPYHCIRFGAQEENGEFLFYANPITRGRREHRFVTFGDAADYLEEAYAITRNLG